MHNHAAAMAGAGIFMMVAFAGIVFGIFVAWILSLLEVIKNKYDGENTRIIWIVLLLVIPPLATILYQFIGKKQKI